MFQNKVSLYSDLDDEIAKRLLIERVENAIAQENAVTLDPSPGIQQQESQRFQKGRKVRKKNSLGCLVTRQPRLIIFGKNPHLC